MRYCRLCGARPVIGVDPIDARLALLPADVIGVHPERLSVRDIVASATRRRLADVVFEATGNAQLIPGEFEVLRREQGRFVVLSSPRGEPAPFDFHDLANSPSHTIIGAHVNSHPPVETPQTPWTIARNAELFFDLVSDRELELEPLISHRLALRRGPERLPLAARGSLAVARRRARLGRRRARVGSWRCRRTAARDRTDPMPGDAPQIVNLETDGLIPYELDGPSIPR